MTQQNMVRMVTIDKMFNKSLTLVLNSTFEMTSHSWTTFKFAILNAFFSYVLPLPLTKPPNSYTLATNLLTIVARFFYCDYNIPNLVIVLSNDVPIDVAKNIDDDPVVSSYVKLIVRLGKGIGEDW